MIQYFHKRRSHGDRDYILEGTIAIDLPLASDLHALLSAHGNQLLLRVGFSIKSDRDNFNKKVGRDLAVARMIPTVCNFRELTIHNTQHLYIFEVPKLEFNHKAYGLKFMLKIYDAGRSPKLGLVDIYEVNRDDA